MRRFVTPVLHNVGESAERCLNGQTGFAKDEILYLGPPVCCTVGLKNLGFLASLPGRECKEHRLSCRAAHDTTSKVSVRSVTADRLLSPLVETLSKSLLIRFEGNVRIARARWARMSRSIRRATGGQTVLPSNRNQRPLHLCSGLPDSKRRA